MLSPKTSQFFTHSELSEKAKILFLFRFKTKMSSEFAQSLMHESTQTQTVRVSVPKAPRKREFFKIQIQKAAQRYPEALPACLSLFSREENS